jgi:DNA-binding transcriptional ArsR family regulator
MSTPARRAAPAKTAHAKKASAAKKAAPAKTAPAEKAAPATSPRAQKTQAAKRRTPAVVAIVRDEQPRPLTDPRVIRALAHPVRIALLEALLREGPLTATEAAELLADSPGNMSWHLQTLAKYGFVEEAEGGVGRRRPWRRVAIGTSYEESADDPELSIAATALSEIGSERAFERLTRWYAVRGSYSPQWQHAWFMTHTLNYLLPDELEQLGKDIHALIAPYRERVAHPDRRPPGSQPVNVVAFGHPLTPNPSGN